LFFFILSGQIQLVSQDILYKKDSKILLVNIKSIDGKTVIYELPEDFTGNTYYISKSVLDSLRYKDGKLLNFSDLFLSGKAAEKKTTRNILSADVFNYAFRNLNISYERISGTGKIGFKTEILINLNSGVNEYQYWYPSDYSIFAFYNYDPHYFFIRLGVNFYPFNYSLVQNSGVRLFTGFSVLLGSYREYNYSQNYMLDVVHPVLAKSLMWNLGLRVYCSNSLHLKAGFDVSILPFLTFICPDIGFSVGF
jgi:hypothetical protein